jgi:hypothetical protein
MDATEILEKAKSGEEPASWIVLPIQRNKLLLGIFGWAAGIVMGFALFAFVASIVIPYNYERGIFPAIFTTLILGVILFIGFGSLWSMITDIVRLRNADRYLIVITPDDFVQQQGKKITQVPLTHVRYVTARGARPPDRSTSGNAMEEVPRSGENVAGFIFGRAFFPSGQRARRKRMRTPTTLAFLDARSDREVVIAADNVYGDPFVIAAHLKEYAARVQHKAEQRG